MLSSALISLGVAGSALAWPGFGSSRHSSIARAVHARQELVTAKPKEPVAATWFASWHADEFSLANYTTVSYSFALTTPNISFVNISDPEVFKDFVSTAHANNVSATISIGGWTGSIYFSSAVATAENRTEFVKTMVNLLNDNKLDGLSFDWEYPGAAGIGCNTNSPNDTTNFLLFLQELRTALPNATLSAATSINPFISADGTPSTNVSDFASVFDYIQIMNYDIWGPWSDTTGPNAPLNDTCATNATQKVGSAVSAVEAWTKAGFPADQIVLGVAGYGHGFSVTPANALNDSILNPYSTFNKSFTPPGDAWDDMPVGPNGTVALDNGFLNENGTANTAEGIVYKFDECSQTPFVYNQTSGVFVAFDNAESFAAKGKFINATGLRGFAMWEAGGDFDDILLDSIRSAAGFPEVIEDEDDCEDDGGDDGVQTGNGNSSSGGSGSSNNSGAGSSNNSGSSNSGGSSSNNSGSGSSNNSGNTSGNASGNTSGNTSSGNTSSGNNSSGGSASSTPSTGSNSSNNSGSNNSGSTTSPSVPDDEDEDDEECEDDEYPETPVTSTVNPTYPSATATASASSIVVVQPEGTPTAIVSSSSAPQPSATAAPDAGITDDDDEEECEDDDEIIDAASTIASTSASASTASASTEATASATSSAATVSETSASASETATESATASTSTGSSSASASSTESSSVQPIPTESSATTVSESSTPAPTSVSASASASSTEPALSAEPTSTASAESTPVAESTSAAASSASASAEPTSVEPSSAAASSSAEPSPTEPATSAEPTSSAAPTSVESVSAEPSAPESSVESTPVPTPSAEPSSSASLSAPVFEPTRR
ncbi:chitinase [Rhizoctonia solani]|uniref:Chitinase n=1 Tax=Rhizoctonia solani TaxID=456999 RepID=A0A8H8P626_9AGAM|nr:chitinase [Rhizoctonia solani]QRW26296.1 chitinase [Rhizoctonia solani]